MRKLETICIRCPIGCHLEVEQKGPEVIVSGNSCPRGAEYGKQEFTAPMRTITAVYCMPEGGTITVKTSKPVEKVKYFVVLDAIHSAPCPKNPQFGGVLVENVAGTGADIVITSVNPR